MASTGSGSGYVRPQFSTRRSAGTGSVTRIYKNAADETIGMDEIAIQFYQFPKVDLTPTGHTNSFVTTADISKVYRTLIHEGASPDRTVATIKMIGDYASITTDSGNYYAGTWNFTSNNCEVSWEGNVISVGDTI
jgi:hypothetical protein